MVRAVESERKGEGYSPGRSKDDDEIMVPSREGKGGRFLAECTSVFECNASTSLGLRRGRSGGRILGR